MYDYFYGAQADQFSFIRIPTVLFSQEQFKNISPEAKVLYGILLWALEGLHRLLANDFAFTISDRAAGNIEAAKKEDNNILDFLASEGYVRFEQDTHATSRQLYTAYRRWCDDNVEKPFAEKTFTGYLRKNEERLKLKYTQNIQTGGGKTARGYVGIHVQVNTDAPGQYHFS